MLPSKRPGRLPYNLQVPFSINLNIKNMNPNKKRAGFHIAFAGFLLLSLPLMAAEEIKGNLVTVGWLEKNLYNADVLILDASPTQIYTAKHIPGAISVDIYTWYGLQEMPVGDMEKLYQSWGISSGKKIVIYDQRGTMLATRFILFPLL